jgi:hypothetical protein
MDNADAQELRKFGYAQQLRRSLGAFSSFAVAFSLISVFTGVFAKRVDDSAHAAGGNSDAPPARALHGHRAPDRRGALFRPHSAASPVGSGGTAASGSGINATAILMLTTTNSGAHFYRLRLGP